MTATSRQVLLTSHDAKRCARQVHNEWDPSIEKVEWGVVGRGARLSRVKIRGRAVVSVLKKDRRHGKTTIDPAEMKTRIVMSVIAGELTVAEAARREKVSEQSIGRWKADFLAAGKTALAAGRSGPWSREEQLVAEVADLTEALGEAAVELRVWKKSAEGRLGPSRTSR